MDLFLYIVLSIAYIMTMHFAMGIAKDFNYMSQFPLFIFAGTVGWYLESYLAGFVLAIVLHLIFWNDIFG
ncbi:MAG: hypothetical protein ACEQSA_00270 [Weeksellaceae bacterium]